MTRNPVDAESATVASYWLGVVGFGIGLASMGLSIYTAFSENPDHLLIAGSGWLAAVLVGGTAWLVTVKLLRYVKSREEALRTGIDAYHSDVLQAKRETQAIQAEHERLLSISEYLVTKTVKRATKRAVPAPSASPDEEGGSTDAD